MDERLTTSAGHHVYGVKTVGAIQFRISVK